MRAGVSRRSEFAGTSPGAESGDVLIADAVVRTWSVSW